MTALEDEEDPFWRVQLVNNTDEARRPFTSEAPRCEYQVRCPFVWFERVHMYAWVVRCCCVVVVFCFLEKCQRKVYMVTLSQKKVHLKHFRTKSKVAPHDSCFWPRETMNI